MGTKSEDSNRRVLLIGPPNVGKSVFFNRLTGLDVSMANYAGTTVDYKVGGYSLAGEKVDLIDVPGTYSLNATNEAEEVAVEMLSQGAEAVVCVIDANHLESSLYLLLQVLEYNLPTVVALNRIDILEDKGYKVDVKALEDSLGVPVIPTIAVTGEGFDLLEEELRNCLDGQDIIFRKKLEEEDNWKMAEELTGQVKTSCQDKEVSRKERWGDLLVQPLTGLPLAIIILGLIFGVVVGLGMGIRQFILVPFFRGVVFPPLISVVETIVGPGTFRNILIGEYGFLIKGLEWPFALVLPYVLSFYTALSILEDSGYLPRLGILLDGLLAKIGLSGSNIIPLLLGYGCAIPGIMATRAMNTKKERLTVSTMICLAVPCVSQTGAFIALLSEASLWIVVGLFMFSFLALIGAGLILDKTLEGEKPLTIVEVPELLVPKWNMLGKKVLIRIKAYVFSGAVTMIYGIALAALLYELGILVYIGRFLSPLITGWLRLPEEAAVPLVLGVVRRELSVLPLLEMNLTSLQLFVGATVGLFYVPCIAVLAVLAREFKVSIAVGILTLTTGLSFLLGGIVARIGGLFI
ncbi:ferrous iron transporter B [Halonatronum saccharophilum]|uniref:ferrous iron transporter B n=1 Tax=Halonatronum saccharophilum TaxID=150060 RepID=UPI0004869309|nr:ferrous iron transporter B [Halonatronum saccharophilum]